MKSWNFICAKQLLQPMCLVITYLQGKLAEVCCGFKWIEETIHIYQKTREMANEQ